MKLLSWNKGSLSIESAICITFFTSLVFVLISVIQYIFVFSVSSNALVKTAEKISAYSCVFFKSGLANVSGSVKADVKKALLQKTGGEDSDIMLNLADLALSAVDTCAWEKATEQILKNEINNELTKATGDLFQISVESLSGSSFFRLGNKFSVVAKVSSPYAFPILFKNSGKLSMTIRISGNGWLYGAFSGYDVSDINVWKLDNFKRGRVLENVFGSNLPESFPTVDIYDKTGKMVTMIISIDSTTEFYNISGNLRKKILEEGSKLYKFDGASFGGVTIDKNDYVTKKMLIVFPENIQTSQQIKEVLGAVTTCGTKYGIIVESASYQKSGEK